MNNRKVELLAPAGNYENFKAAITAGADAVYLGGSLFSARAYANNFDEDTLLKALDYAHLHNASVYMTVNTLLKERELEKLVTYLLPYYENGLDGVIVQDLGVVDTIRDYFPDMPVHASTQMSVSGVEGASYLKGLGLTRVVPARELSLPEIKAIYDATGMEIESFIHGALCYCYSGQCLLSSMIGGRSGNRGRCAQPCRLAYTNSIDNKEKYILSPKDMATVKLLPELIENGVYSMKIEGRMKSAEYTAGVVSIYRKYIDMYLEKGKQGYQVTDEDMIALMDLYNRGGFNKGYYQVQNGPEMMSVSRPNHAGVEAIKAISIVKGRVTFKALTALYKGDVFEITNDFNITLGSPVMAGKEFTMQIPAKFINKPGASYSRIKCAKLVQEITDKYISEKELLREKIAGSITVITGENIKLNLWLKKDSNIYVSVEGPVVTKATNRPVDEENIRKQLSKLGDTSFVFENESDLTVVCGKDCFVPMQALNELRRNCVSQLAAIINMLNERMFDETRLLNEGENVDSEFYNASEIHTRILVSNNEQLLKLIHLINTEKISGIDRAYVDYNCFYSEECILLIEQLSLLTTVYVALPRILRQNKRRAFDELMQIVAKCNVSGYLCRTLEECSILKKSGCDNVVADYSMYVWNNKARRQVLKVASEFTAPLELTEAELKLVNPNSMEIVKYGFFPVMLSAQCVKKTTGKCDGNCTRVTISDRKNAKYAIDSNCRFCHTVMYNDKPLYLEESIDKLGTNIRYEFTAESSAEMEKILLNGPESYTTGHFHKGVM